MAFLLHVITKYDSTDLKRKDMSETKERKISCQHVFTFKVIPNTKLDKKETTEIIN